MVGDSLEGLLRELAPQALGAVARRTTDFGAAEDAVQEALLAAATQWPREGIPGNPRGWLVTVASRRLVEQWRRDSARRSREHLAHPDEDHRAAGAEQDDSLELLLLCCHPALTPPSQVALTLRAVGGLTTAEIARGLLVPEATVAQRISRAKAAIRRAGARFVLPVATDLPGRVEAVAAVLYLVFTEGHAASSGTAVTRVDLTAEAIRLTRMLVARATHASALEPVRGEVQGLLALMLLTGARRPARVAPDGSLVPLDRQDRTTWDRGLIDEGIALVTGALARERLGPYQLQAAIAAVHAEAATAADTDWPQVLALYDLLLTTAPGPMVTLSRVVAVAMAHDPATGLLELDLVADDPVLVDHHRTHAVRAHLLERSGDLTAAVVEYLTASRGTRSEPERRYLEARAAALIG
ncbi:sigma-70 family RNA polymerase sigma factor [Actinotalea sp. C106]|uniref:RNA polymerase sigma factor n=1 Tax=Actinotalea sp. C106 TaxID=2908644 RepID=UPI002028FC8A|nr:sigma-70 family RNA polymerase sigma factor [Actinotalea sp. C106]